MEIESAPKEAISKTHPIAQFVFSGFNEDMTLLLRYLTLSR